MISLKNIEEEKIVSYIRRNIQWSKKTFGEGEHTEGLLRHIMKEVEEVRTSVNANLSTLALEEVIDIIILSVDLAWRLGFTPEEITEALLQKESINNKRKYPKITNPDEPTEHIKE